MRRGSPTYLEFDGRSSGARPVAPSQIVPRAPRMIELQQVVITGIGVMLPGCDTPATLWSQLSEGESQLSLEADESAPRGRRVVGRILDFDPSRYLSEVEPRHYANCHREQLLYLSSVAQAADDAGLQIADGTQRAYGLYDGTSRGSFAYWTDEATRSRKLTRKDIGRGMPGQAVGLAAAMFGFVGPSYTFNCSCASGGVAIGHAYRELQCGRTEVAFATGHDAALVPELFQMYGDAGLLSDEADDPVRAIAPFSQHAGNVFGEGAVTLVLETRRHALARGARVLAEVLGFRHRNGGEHPTEVDFTGDMPAAAINDVLTEAEMSADQIGFVLGHGNGVRGSDISELNYMRRVFRQRVTCVPLLSTKPIYGHTLGASSALNAAAATLMLANDYVIPTAGVDARSAVRGFNHQVGRGEHRELDAGLVVAYGIGGQNAVLMLGKVED